MMISIPIIEESTLWVKLDDKRHWLDEIATVIDTHFGEYGSLPTKIVMHPLEHAQTIGTAKGVHYRGQNISVIPHKMCILKHIKLIK